MSSKKNVCPTCGCGCRQWTKRQETARRTGLANRGRKMGPMPQERRQKISETRKKQGSPWAKRPRRAGAGRIFTPEHRAKAAEARRRQGATRSFTPADYERAADSLRVRTERRLMGRDDVTWAPGYEPGVPKNFSDANAIAYTIGTDGET